jgi:hypothetical protein
VTGIRIARTIPAVLLLASTACSNDATADRSSKRTDPSHSVSDRDYDPSNFDSSTRIDNEWFPLLPGTEYTWKGHATEDGRRINRTVVFTVTDLTKVIDGVRTVVAWDRDYNEGVKQEIEIAFFAQDNQGNVWHFGQYPEEYQGRRIVKTPAWIAGVHDARPGISMKADPRLGTPSYAQGWGPEVNWTDRARTYAVDRKTCVPFDCYDDVLVIDEFNRDEPGAHQLKYYAPGVGGVRVGWRGSKEEEKEVLVLTDLEQLTADELAHVRAEVLAQEKRAYRLSKEVYGKTQPIERASNEVLA